MYLRSRLRRAVVAVLCAKVVGLILLFDYGSRMLSAIDMPKALWSRATEWVLLGLLTVLLIRHGGRLFPRTRLHLAVIGVIVANIASTVLAENRYLALYGVPTKFEGLTNVGDMAVMYCAAAVAVRTRIDRLGLFLSFGVATVVACAYAFAQFAGLDPIAWNMDPQVRPFATLGNPNVLGHLLSIAAGVGAGAAIVPSLTPRHWLRVIGVLLAATAIACSAIVATRGSFLGIGAVCIATAIVAVRLYGGDGVRPRVALPVAGAALLAAVVLMASPLGTRALLTLQGGVTTADRVAVYRIAASAYRDKPVLGSGPDSFAVVWRRYLEPGDAQLFETVANDSAHDWVLQAAATTGSVGLVALVIFAASTVVALWRRIRDDAVLVAPLLVGLAAYWAQGLVSVGSVGVDWFPWLAAGLAVGAHVEDARDRTRPHPALIAAILGVAVVGAASGLVALRANVGALTAQHATSLRDYRRAVEAGEESVSLDPGRADNWNELGRARYFARDWAGSEGAFRAVVERAPYEPQYWANLAIAIAGRYSESHDVASRDAALATVRVMLDLNPNYPPTLLAAADVAEGVDAHDDATLFASRALVLRPESLAAVAVARSAGKATDVTVARGLVMRALERNNSVHLHSAAAALALASGDRQAAEQHVSAALALNPSDPVALEVQRKLRL